MINTYFLYFIEHEFYFLLNTANDITLLIVLGLVMQGG